MPSTAIRHAILIVAYQHRADLEGCLLAIRRTTSAYDDLQTVVVDNSPHPETQTWLATEFPEVRLISASYNLGYADGNNLGWEAISADCPDLVTLTLLNQDTLPQGNWLEELISFMDAHPQVVLAQPLVTLLDEPQLVNTSGNRCHYLGFGLMTDYRQPVSSVGTQPVQIDSASGAAVTIRASWLRQATLFPAGWFMYLEDVALSWQARLMGCEVWLVPTAVVQHRHTLSHVSRSYYCLERNRWRLLLAAYRWRTLVLLGPALALMELGQLAFAFSQGLLTTRVRLWCGLFDGPAWRKTWKLRQTYQRLRQVSDYETTRHFCATFPKELLPSAAVQQVANPIFRWFWRLAKRCLWW
jgi:GT2 family glycosyltransferase